MLIGAWALSPLLGGLGWGVGGVVQAMKQQLEFYEAKGDRQVAVVAEQINSGAAIGTVLATAGKSEPQGRRR